MFLYVCKQIFCKLYEQITQDLLGLRLQNLQNIIFIWIGTYRKSNHTLQICISVLLNCCLYITSKFQLPLSLLSFIKTLLGSPIHALPSYIIPMPFYFVMFGYSDWLLNHNCLQCFDCSSRSIKMKFYFVLFSIHLSWWLLANIICAVSINVINNKAYLLESIFKTLFLNFLCSDTAYSNLIWYSELFFEDRFLQYIFHFE